MERKSINYVGTIYPAEQDLMDWLNRCKLPFVFVDQSSERMPAQEKPGIFKRADFIVAIPGLCSVIVEVKGYRLHGGYAEVKESEAYNLQEFGKLFHMDTYFLFINGNDNTRAHWAHPNQYLRDRLELERKELLQCEKVMRYGKPDLALRLNLSQTVPSSVKEDDFVSKLCKAQRLVNGNGPA